MANLIQGIGVAKPVSQTIASALGIGGLLESQRRTGLLERREASAEQDAAQLRQIRNMQIQEQKWQMEPINPRTTGAWLGLTDLERKKFEPWLNQVAPHGQLVPRNKFYQELGAFVKTEPFQRMAQEASMEASNAVMKAYEKYQANPTPDNKTKLDKAMQQSLVIDKRYTDLAKMLGQGQDLEAVTARAKAMSKGKVEGLLESVPVEDLANAILEGRETIENVKNSFGIPIQEAVRQRVLEKDKNFNFVVPRAAVKTLTSSLAMQEKSRGMMGSFVRNLNKQLNRVDEIVKKLGRSGLRLLDLPIRELKVRALGSGQEAAYSSYLMEISNEIGKLSTGSAASIRELSTEAQARWARIHDPNLSMNEIKIILDETRKMGEFRLSSTDEEIAFTRERLKNLAGRGTPTQKTIPSLSAPALDLTNFTTEELKEIMGQER